MATPSKILANRHNSRCSTGPRTIEGKIKSARNATKFGLFSANVLVRPEDEAQFEAISAALWKDLRPEGALQESLAIEIIRATWRLERCARVESALIDNLLETGLDPMQHQTPQRMSGNEAAAKTQVSVDRARAQAQTMIRRASADLRRLQTDRQMVRETFSRDVTPPDLGLVCMKDVVVSIYTQNKAKWLIAQNQYRQRTVAHSVPVITSEPTIARAR